MSISTHILDTAIGRPAAGVPVALARLGEDNCWVMLTRMRTDADGRRAPVALNSVNGALHQHMAHARRTRAAARHDAAYAGLNVLHARRKAPCIRHQLSA